MKFQTNLITGLLLLSAMESYGQAPAPRELPAKRTTQPVKIDGLLNDSAWKDAAIMTDMVEFRPNVGRLENPETKTIAYLMYDDEGIYFGGYCYERTRDSIASELKGRDGFGTNDYVGIIFDTYHDKINGFEYFVTPVNEQWDAKMSPNPNGNSEDFTWNAVWKSGAVIHNDGWSFEMFIPYSAIRFGKKEIQNWGLNITRRRRKTEQQNTWNPIDPNVSGFLTQEGIWTGVSNIKPPLRLEFSPYFSTYINHFPSSNPGTEEWTSSINGGMDVKYGISQAFTLDLTLIPDFGQVQSDNQVLNLTPFETKYQERRPFFTEGTELFNKGNLFYSRRVGGRPLRNIYNMISPTDVVIKNPSETKLINAAKLSGRTQSGLGIGFFNAITSAQHAIVEDVNKNRYEVETSPLTNYNIIVLNQSLKNNSSISFVNTNVLRNGSDYDANVTAGLFDFFDKKNTWNLGGKVSASSLVGILPGDENLNGYSHSLYFGKVSGRFNFNITQNFANDKYNYNDLGIMNFNNFLEHSMWAGYRWIKPTNWYNNIYLNFNVFYSRQVEPASYRNAMINVNANSQLKNLWYVGGLIGYEPEFNDFNEPRVPGRVFRGWSNTFYDLWTESNQSKKYAIYSEVLFVNRSMFDSKRFQINMNHRYRFSDKFSVSQGLYLEPQKRNVGFAAIDPATNEIIFGKRDRNAVEVTLDLKYNFNRKMGIRSIIRHYWSKVDYDEYFTLLPDGELQKNTTFAGNTNQNVNFFNLDMTYTWEFAPGSFINIVWKDAAYHFNNLIEPRYFKNVSNTLDSDQNNNLSLKVIYFLDYLTLKKSMKKK